MNETTEDKTPDRKTPWHLWVIGVVSLLWNSVGLVDFLMTQTKNEAYMSSFTPEQLEYFYSFPVWANIAWGIAIFGSILGSLLLLLRNKLSVPVFVISLLAMISTAIYNFGLSNGMDIMGTFGAIFTVVIFLIAVFLAFYAIKMKQTGVLR